MSDDLTGWLHDLVWSIGPVAPGSAIAAQGIAATVGKSGGTAVVDVEVVNEQQAAVAAVFQPGVMRSDDGHVWYPRVVARSTSLFPALESRRLTIEIAVPSTLPPSSYRGTLGVLAIGGHLALEVEVVDGELRDSP